MLRVTKTLSLVVLALAIAASALATLFAAAASSPATGPASALSIPLYGSIAAPAGWGWTPNNISNNLVLTVNQGDVITFHLYANDSIPHQLIIDLDNSHTNTTGDSWSPDFTSSTTATDWTYTAATAGTFAFFCGIHGWAAQNGTLVVQSTGGDGGGGTTPTGIDTTLLIGGVIVVVAIVAVAAAAMMRRGRKSPPQPPTQP